MSNVTAIRNCFDLVEALANCREKQTQYDKLIGTCFDEEKAVRLCRHNAREGDRRVHVEKALQRRKEVEDSWKKMEDEGFPPPIHPTMEGADWFSVKAAKKK